MVRGAWSFAELPLCFFSSSEENGAKWLVRSLGMERIREVLLGREFIAVIQSAVTFVFPMIRCHLNTT